VSRWPATKASRVYDAARLRIGWTKKRRAGGSHQVLSREGFADVVWAFHERDEIGPKVLARIARRAGLTPEDL
jgi:predicted RNA binding protein YcfA (HicA-like mRNA interferase family)